MNTVYLGLGSNIGDKRNYLLSAISLIKKLVGSVLKESAIYESEPWGFEHDSSFYNMVICVESNFEATQILKIIQNIEKDLGRIRNFEQYSARTLDIDILFFNHTIINSEELKIPHPLIPQRNFVLKPMVEIAPDFLHPILKKTIVDLLNESTDTCKTEKLE
jgi:2-amino-4-hydroxy-6-hydroxymethyldihydropteridine diphosphokinase